MNSKRVIFWRVYGSFFLLVLLALGVVGSIVKIQYIDGEKWRSEAAALMTKLVDVEAKRGDIYAGDGSLLATSLYRYNVHMDTWATGITKTAFDKDVDSLAYQLAELFKGPGEKTKWEWKNALETARAQKNRYLKIRDDVSHTDLKLLKSFKIFNRGQYKGGIIIEPRNERIHPYGHLAKRTLGYLRPNDTSYLVGLEGYFNNYIGGQPGKILKQKVSSKVWIPVDDANTVDPIDGKDLYTTIDVNIQDIVETALMRGVSKHKAHDGCAIVMEVKTGKIVAIANLKKSGINQEFYSEIYNYAIGERTQPGSTFKLAPLLALLENDYMRPTDTISTGDGKWKIYDRTLRDEKGYGTLSLQKGFEISSNVMIAKAMDRHFGDKQQDFTDFLSALKIDKSFNLPIAGEREPYIKTPDSSDWSGTTLSWMAHGYELELTPLQVLNMYNTVANNGTVMRPMLVTEVRNVNRTEKEFQPQVLARNVLSKRTVRYATEILKGVVDSGTALYYVRTAKIKIAGKTGTAVLEKTDEGKKYQASFAGFFPANAPKYSCIVVVHDPQEKQYYGAQVAGPIFKEIAEGIHSLDITIDDVMYAENVIDYGNRPTFLLAKTDDFLNIYQALGLKTEERKSYPMWSEPVLTSDKIAIKEHQPKEGIPDVKGLSLTDALFICENAGLKVKFEGTGTVYRQVPEKNTPYSMGKTIYINLK